MLKEYWEWFFQPEFFLYFCIRKSYPNKQSNADYGNWNGCQLITRKRGNSSNPFDFKEVYSLYRLTEIFCMADDLLPVFWYDDSHIICPYPPRNAHLPYLNHTKEWDHATFSQRWLPRHLKSDDCPVAEPKWRIFITWQSSHILLGHWALCYLAIEYYATWPLSIMLLGHWALCSLANEYYAPLPLSIMLPCQRVLCSLAIEHYAPLPTSIMLPCQRALCSLAIEYYAPLPLSIMLPCHWALCSLAIEHYAPLPLSIMLLGHWALCYLAIEHYATWLLSIMLLGYWALCYLAKVCWCRFRLYASAILLLQDKDEYHSLQYPS